MIYIIFILLIVFLLVLINFFLYKRDIKNAYERLNSYDIRKFKSNYGEMTYIDKGKGEVVLVSHGIFGGYDQGYVSLNKLLRDDYRKVSMSRFGYPGSNLPEDPSCDN